MTYLYEKVPAFKINFLLNIAYFVISCQYLSYLCKIILTIIITQSIRILDNLKFIIFTIGNINIHLFIKINEKKNKNN